MLQIYHNVKGFSNQFSDYFLTLWLLMLVSIKPLIFVIVWGIILFYYQESMPDFLVSIDSTALGVIGFFVTFSVGYVIQGQLGKHYSAIERYNAFCGQCLDFSINMYAYIDLEKPNSRFDIIDTITLTNLLALAVKFLQRGQYNHKLFTSQSNKIWGDRHLITIYKEKYDRLPYEDNDRAFVSIYWLLFQQLEKLKDDHSINNEEWQEALGRLESIYGPWGDIATRISYSLPRGISSFFQLTLLMYYFFLVPSLVAKNGIVGFVWSMILVLLFSGGFEISIKIGNPFHSSKDYFFFYDANETVSVSNKMLKNQLTNILQMANSVSGSGIKKNMRPSLPFSLLHSRY